MKNISSLKKTAFGGRYNLTFMAAFAVAAVFIVMPEAAFAQAGGDPFASAAGAARNVRKTFTSFALAIGGIGMVACLLLGFFGKLNWKWVATGIGVSFALAIVPTAINWLDGLSGGAGGG